MMSSPASDSPPVDWSSVTASAPPSVAAAEFLEMLSDAERFEAWYRQTMPRVYSYLVSRSGGDADLAEDLVQLTYLAAIQQRWRFDGRADTVTWLIGIARHKLADHYRALERADRRRLRLEVRELERPHASAADAIEERDAIAEAFRTLPPSQRAMLAFVAQDGLTVAEAGRLLGRSPGAAQSLLHRAREGFRAAYRSEAADA